MREVANPCTVEAFQRLQRICSRCEEEESGQNLRNESTVPKWAKEEYFAQRMLPKEHGPEPVSDNEGAQEHDVASKFANQLQKGGKRKPETLASGRRLKRTRHLAGANSR